ncbi:hypothetical protein ACFS07_12335 [Undibacterium arcticum]
MAAGSAANGIVKALEPRRLCTAREKKKEYIQRLRYWPHVPITDKDKG